MPLTMQINDLQDELIKTGESNPPFHRISQDNGLWLPHFTHYFPAE